jgi:Zn-dependent protease
MTPHDGEPAEPVQPGIAAPAPVPTGEPTPAYAVPSSQPSSRPLAAPPSLGTRLKQLFGPVIALGAAIAKWGVIIFKFKLFVVAGSMVVSVAAYATIFGWKFAVGFVLLILVHELGHVVALRRMGIAAGAPVFIPFLGAFVSMKSAPRSAWEEAISGIAGPIAGTVGACGCWWYAHATGSSFWLALAFTGFFLNLFNLMPVLPLDGGRTAAALHPAIWALGLAGLVVLEFYRPTPILPIILILGGIEMWRRWKGRNTDASRAYYKLTPEQRRVIAVLYLGLIVFLVFAHHATYVKRTL